MVKYEISLNLDCYELSNIVRNLIFSGITELTNLLTLYLKNLRYYKRNEVEYTVFYIHKDNRIAE